MRTPKFISNSILTVLKLFLSVKEKPVSKIETPGKVLIVRQHNQFGDLLASLSLLRAVKETFPGVFLAVIASPQNYYALTQNKFVDQLFVFDKKKLFTLSYLKKLKRFLKQNFDLSITPSTVSISLTSLLLMRFSDAKMRIGPNSLNGKQNKYRFLFDRRVDLDWTKKPDAHVSDFGLDIVRPFGIDTEDFSTEINIKKENLDVAKDFIKKTGINTGEKLVGLHIGAGKPKNRWSLDKYIELVKSLNNEFRLKFYLTGSDSDLEELNYFSAHCSINAAKFINKKIPDVAALISLSDLFITNDTGIMHVAGATNTPQISIFGPTNPFNWAPVGQNKYFIRKSDLIDDVRVEDVFTLCKKILGN